MIRDLTYSKRSITAENFPVCWVNYDLKLLHALGAVRQKRGEHLLELVLDGKRRFLERNFSVLDVSDARWSARHKFMSKFLQSRERSIAKKFTLLMQELSQ